MNETLVNNAYHILGLSPTDNNRQILSRSKEIINRLKIDDVPEYDLDIGLIPVNRTEHSVQKASQKLQQPKEKLIESFFWFRFTTPVDIEVLSYLKRKDFNNAIRIWKNAADIGDSHLLNYQKNLSLLFTLLLHSEYNPEYLRESLGYWSSTFSSDQFRRYLQHELINEESNLINLESLTSFETTAKSYLSDIFTELYQIHKEPDAISKFLQLFPIKGEKLNKTVLEPTFQNINTAAENLRAMNISEDGVLSKEEKNEINKNLKTVETQLAFLGKLALYEDSQVLVMRDKTSTALNKICLDLHNNLDETDYAINLLKIAKNLVGTRSLESKFEENLNQLNEQTRQKRVMEKLKELVEKDKFDQALLIIKSERIEIGEEDELNEILDFYQKLCIISKASEKFQKAHDLFDSENWDQSRSLFTEAKTLILDNVALFLFTPEYVNSLDSRVTIHAIILSPSNVQSFDATRKKFLDEIKSHFDDWMEQTALLIIIDKELFNALGTLVSNFKRNKTASQYSQPSRSTTSQGCLTVIMSVLILSVLWIFI